MNNIFITCNALQVVNVAKRNLLQLIMGILVCSPQALFCGPGLWLGSGLPLVKTARESAEKTVPSLALRGIAKVIDISNEHKALGGAIVGLAGVGALYILTRPYAWANEQTEKEKSRADLAEAQTQTAAAESQALRATNNLLQFNQKVTEKGLRLTEQCLQVDEIREKTVQEMRDFLAENKRLNQDVEALQKQLAEIKVVQEGSIGRLAQIENMSVQAGIDCAYFRLFAQRLGVYTNNGRVSKERAQDIFNRFVTSFTSALQEETLDSIGDQEEDTRSTSPTESLKKT